MSSYGSGMICKLLAKISILKQHQKTSHDVTLQTSSDHHFAFQITGPGKSLCNVSPEVCQVSPS